MTDLERAHTERAREDQWIAPSREQWNAALATASREGMEHAARIDRAMLDNAERVGAAKMRERAAREARYWTASQKVADRILALPLTPEEPA